MIINNLLALALMVFGSPEDELTVDAAPRRTSRCPGCKLSGDNHHFGSPGPQCSGPAQIDISEVQVSPKAPTSGAKKPARKKDRVPAMSIDAQLEHCATEERRLREELEHQTKMKQLQEANARVEALRRQVSSSASQQPLTQPPTQRSENAVSFPVHPLPQTSTTSQADVSHHHVSRPEDERYRFESFLQSSLPRPEATGLAGLSCSDVTATGLHLQQALPLPAARTNAGIPNRETQILLKPGAQALQAGGKPKVLRIIDYLRTYIPSEQETILSSGDFSTKLVVSKDSPKKKLEQVSIAEYNIANIRIYNHLRSMGGLHTEQDVQDYLAYTIRINQLASSHEWVSVLRFDDEFRSLQAIYHLPWSHESSHLNLVYLRPLGSSNRPNLSSTTHQQRSTPPNPPTSGVRAPASNPPSQFVHLAPSGVEFCRNFNRISGCTFNNCPYRHACNKNLGGGRSCNLPHSGSQHRALLQTPTSQ